MVTTTRTLAAAFVFGLIFGAARGASAQEARQTQTVQTVQTANNETAPIPTLHHAAVSSARVGEDLQIQAELERADLVKAVFLVYNTKGAVKAIPMRRSPRSGYVAVIPGSDVLSTGVGYTIEIEQVDGTRRAMFASRDALHDVVVNEDSTDVEERWALHRVGGRRSVVGATVEFVRFGTTTGTFAIPCAANQEGCKPGEMKIPQVDDQYWRAEASYTYRPLRTIAELTFRLGVVRGRSLVDLPELDDEKYDVGLNFGGASVRFRFTHWMHMELSALTSITEVGFSAGAGTNLIFGDPFGTKFTMGWETIGFTPSTYFGTRLFTRLDLAAHERLMVSPSIEVTDMPHAGEFGVRLLTDLGIPITRGFSIIARGGYQARISKSGGPTVGATLQLAF